MSACGAELRSLELLLNLASIFSVQKLCLLAETKLLLSAKRVHNVLSVFVAFIRVFSMIYIYMS